MTFLVSGIFIITSTLVFFEVKLVLSYPAIVIAAICHSAYGFYGQVLLGC